MNSTASQTRHSSKPCQTKRIWVFALVSILLLSQASYAFGITGELSNFDQESGIPSELASEEAPISISSNDYLETEAYVNTDSYVCMIGTVCYLSIDAALSQAQNGDTIRLTTDTKPIGATETDLLNPGGISIWAFASIFLSAKRVTIDTNGYILDLGQRIAFDGAGNIIELPYYHEYGIWVTNGGCLDLIDSSVTQTGKINAHGTIYAVRASGYGSKVTVSNATLEGSNGRSSSVFAEKGGSIIVTGDVTGGIAYAARAESGGSITILGNVESSAATTLFCTGQGSSIKAYGYVHNASGLGIAGSALRAETGTSIEVYGNVLSSALDGAVATGKNATIQIIGNLTAYYGRGVIATGNARVTISGTLDAPDYIMLGYDMDNIVLYVKASGTPSEAMPGYYEYTDTSNFVYVMSDGSISANSVGAPGSGDLYGVGYTTMSNALIVAQAALGISMNLSPAQFAAADMDFDGVLTMTDVLLVMRKACGL